jgi:cytoskeleton protein RodZ
MVADAAPTTGAGAAAGGESAVGTVLRSCRLKAGYDLTELSRQLRIRRAFLEAIEDGRFKDLPGPTYAIGFVRAYADYFGLDTQEIVRRFRSESGERNGTQALHFPAPVAEGGTPRGAVILIGLLIAGIAYGAWYLNTVHGNLISDIVAPVPERLRHLIEGGEQAAGEAGGRTGASETTTAAAPPGSITNGSAGQEAPLVVVPVPPRSAAPPAAPTASPPAAPHGVATTNTPASAPPPGVQVAVPAATSPTAAPPAAVPEATVAPAPAALPEETTSSAAQASAPVIAPTAPPSEGGSRVLLRASADSWVQIRDPATRVTLLSRVLKAGESFAVPDTPGLLMTVGNAGGLEVVVDGEVLPPLGREGAVRRNVPLDVDALRHSSGGSN